MQAGLPGGRASGEGSLHLGVSSSAEVEDVADTVVETTLCAKQAVARDVAQLRLDASPLGVAVAAGHEFGPIGG